MHDLLTNKQSDLLSEAYKRYLSYCAEAKKDGFSIVSDDQAHQVLYWFIKDSGLMPANQPPETNGGDKNEQ